MVKGGGEVVSMYPNAENAFSEDIFWQNSVHIKTTLNIDISEIKTEK